MNSVDRLHMDLAEVSRVLGEARETSLQLVVQDQARKVTVLAASSYFERQIAGSLDGLANGASVLLREFVRNKAIARQYHALFEWNAKNASKFFGLFGGDFKEKMKARVKADDVLASSIVSFLELGLQRNRLVHEDYATFPLEKTSQEIFDLYKSALYFVEKLPELLEET